jgi:hypothetical protein
VVIGFGAVGEVERPDGEDLDDLIGDGGVLENTAPAPDEANAPSVTPSDGASLCSCPI